MGPAGEFLDCIESRERALLGKLFGRAANPFASAWKDSRRPPPA